MSKISRWSEFGLNEAEQPKKWTINTAKDVENFLLDLAKAGKMFHFDDPAAEIVDRNDTPLFTEEEAANVQDALDKSFEVCEKAFGKDGFWEGMIKDVIASQGLIVFGADVEPATGDVYVVSGDGGPDSVRTTTLVDFQEMSKDPRYYTEETGYTDEVEKWFSGLKKA